MLVPADAHGDSPLPSTLRCIQAQRVPLGALVTPVVHVTGACGRKHRAQHLQCWGRGAGQGPRQRGLWGHTSVHPQKCLIHRGAHGVPVLWPRQSQGHSQVSSKGPCSHLWDAALLLSLCLLHTQAPKHWERDLKFFHHHLKDFRYLNSY